MELPDKIINGLERLSEALKSLLWEKAKVHGLSPIQIQILLFVDSHRSELCNVSHLAKEFNVTKATVSDAVRVLLHKELLEKDLSPTDNRRYNLMVTRKGKKVIDQLIDYSSPILEEVSNMDKDEMVRIFETITKLIYQLNQRDVIQVQRTCFKCKYYEGDKDQSHYCKLMDMQLKRQDVRLDCPEFEEKSGL